MTVLCGGCYKYKENLNYQHNSDKNSVIKKYRRFVYNVIEKKLNEINTKKNPTHLYKIERKN